MKKNKKNIEEIKFGKNNGELKWNVNQNLSPLILLAKAMSLVIIVTLFPWIAHKFVSSKIPTKYASAASYNANTAAA